MFKLGMALVFSGIAALVIMIVGLISDARFITIALRCLVGFLATGVVVYLVAFLLETKEIVGFDRNLELEEVLAEEENLHKDASDEDEENAEMEESQVEASDMDQMSQEEGFQPFDEGNFRHVESPPES